jgi:hypothetical protein
MRPHAAFHPSFNCLENTAMFFTLLFLWEYASFFVGMLSGALGR